MTFLSQIKCSPKIGQAVNNMMDSKQQWDKTAGRLPDPRAPQSQTRLRKTTHETGSKSIDAVSGVKPRSRVQF